MKWDRYVEPGYTHWWCDGTPHLVTYLDRNTNTTLEFYVQRYTPSQGYHIVAGPFPTRAAAKAAYMLLMN